MKVVCTIEANSSGLVFLDMPKSREDFLKAKDLSLMLNTVLCLIPSPDFYIKQKKMSWPWPMYVNMPVRLCRLNLYKR